MNLDRFLTLLDTFGSDFRRWPDDLRRPGEAFLAASPAARERWEAARRLDALFRLDHDHPVDAMRSRAIIDAALRRIRALPERAFDWRWLFSRRIGSALATAALAGLTFGFLLGPGLRPPPDEGVPAVAVLLGHGPLDAEGLF